LPVMQGLVDQSNKQIVDKCVPLMLVMRVPCMSETICTVAESVHTWLSGCCCEWLNVTWL